MVLPGDELSVKLTHVAMNAGNKVVKVETFNQRDEKVIEGTAEVMQPRTTYGLSQSSPPTSVMAPSADLDSSR